MGLVDGVIYIVSIGLIGFIGSVFIHALDKKTDGYLR
jgi:hypothetical protein